MKARTIILITALSCAFYSCKKDKLEGDKSILIGEWEWVYTEKVVDYCDPDYTYTQILTPSTELTTWQIKFIEKGKVEFYQDNSLLDAHKIVFDSFGYQYSGIYASYKSFQIHLDNEESLQFYGMVSSDSIIVLKNFPYPDKDVFEPGVDCYLTTSFFARK
jgi:hypothetical protein